MSPYYGLEGEPINWEQFVDLCRLRSQGTDGDTTPDQDPTRIGSDHVGDVWVSTVWMGVGHSLGDGCPLVFETMVFGGLYDHYCWRYSTRAAALAGHERAVALVRDGMTQQQVPQ